jgi:hypothetical protein
MALDAAYADGDEFQQWLFSHYEIPGGPVSKADEDHMHQFDMIRKAFAVHTRDLPGVIPLTRTELRERLATLEVKIKEYGGTSCKKRNVVILHPLPEAQNLISW